LVYLIKNTIKRKKITDVTNEYYISKNKIIIISLFAEHSTYFTALSSLASFSPCSNDIDFCLFLASFSTVVASSLRSICVPTNRNGIFLTFSLTFSNEDGETTEKQTRNTSVCG
ncbi:putative secreted protein, partial [Aphis craccivora]